MKKNMIIIVLGIIVLIVVILVLRILAVGMQVPRYAAYWKQRAEQTAADDSLYYVAFGDSAAQGVGAARPEQSYVGQLAYKMQTKTGRDIHTVNLSVSGARVKDALHDQLPVFKKLSLPTGSVVTIEVGANDMKDFEPQKFTKEIDELLSQIPEGTIVGNIPYFGGGIFRMRETSVIEANKILERAANKHNLTVADLHRYTKDNDSLRNYGGDLFHPNKRGYNNWANAYWEVLEPKL